ncbi:Xre family transcriptional regulator [Rhodobacter aestuarii]|uniref:Transcriptional regulator, XRE family n=1 Tax=Rhodobacter aestuarii TaxID=453582 RepID=A0A1N7JBR8_9RHOB|nr:MULTISPECIES: helix-turn-helix domain-containing protein [Rhodobacter]PTV96966.1 Xre family transcriptional regulator [Rhodobacter aestuarii]SIS46711.1 transcriptional regulator, XRE family [Rhodobacter aestuarii]SOB98191.1 Xre family transcriptional regulator [Rhodobacter sp. JA431]
MDAEDPDHWFDEAVATFGDRLSAARDAAMHSRASLAEKLGVAPDIYDSWEDDSAMPRANQIQMLSGMLGVSLAWLLTGEGPGIPAPHDAAQAEAELERLTEDLHATQARMEQLEERVRQMMLRLE